MRSGKTTELWRKLHIYASAKKKDGEQRYRVLYINHGKDARCEGDDLSTHNTQLKKKSKSVIKRKLSNLLFLTDIDAWDVIGIDEGQFFPSLKPAREWVLKHKKVVIISSLVSDFNLELFGTWHKFATVCGAGKINFLGGYCDQCVQTGLPVDKSVGSFNSLRNRDEHDTSQNIIIGGAETYQTLCLDCWLVNNKM